MRRIHATTMAAAAVSLALAACSDNGNEGGDTGAAGQATASTELGAAMPTVTSEVSQELDQLLDDGFDGLHVAYLSRNDGTIYSAGEAERFTKLSLGLESYAEGTLVPEVRRISDLMQAFASTTCYVSGSSAGVPLNGIAPPVSAASTALLEPMPSGESLTVRDDLGVYATLVRADETQAIYEEQVASDRTIEGSAVVTLTGGEFPSIGDVVLAEPEVFSIDNLDLDEVKRVAIGSELNWQVATSAAAGVTFHFEASNDSAQASITCQAPDTGSFRVPDDVLARLPASLTHANLFATRQHVETRADEGTLVYAISSYLANTF